MTKGQLHNIGPLLNLNPRFQRGYGIYRRSRQSGSNFGNVFSGLFRYLKPLLSKGLKSIAKEAVAATTDVLDSPLPLKYSIKTRGKEALNNLKEKAKRKLDSLQEGSGVRRKRKRLTGCKIQKKIKPKKKKIKTNKKQKERDIFS